MAVSRLEEDLMGKMREGVGGRYSTIEGQGVFSNISIYRRMGGHRRGGRS